MNDLALLQRYAPVVRYTYGELYFPCAVDEYVKRCSLWIRDGEGNRRQLAAAGELTTEKLATYGEVPDGHTLYMRLVEAPMEILDYQRWRRRANRPVFHAPGRLARVGLISRIIDSLFDLSLVVRGTVPGGTSAVAEQHYREMLRADPRRVYYARVRREAGYILLHYLFFYPMNDWRSSFFGINDHEADWEQVFVYLSEEIGEPLPRWVAYASHDFSGDDLRRRWDDPELHKVDGTHPVVYAGAGSHASYFKPGEYVMGVEPKALQPVTRGIRILRDFWTKTLGMGIDSEAGSPTHSVNILRIPFVDYARGDGLAIGQGQQEEWTPILISNEVGWVDHYRGLWGLDTKDPFGGERAPSGPKYNRDGSVRRSWYDPLGWVGLDKVAPPGRTIPALERKIDRLVAERTELEQQIEQKREGVRQLALEVAALQESEYVADIEEHRQESLALSLLELHAMVARRANVVETRKATQNYLERIQAGDWGNPQSHLHHIHDPAPPVRRHRRGADTWSALSGGFLLLAVIALFAVRPPFLVGWILLLGVIFFGIEAAVRGYLGNYLLNIAVILAFITAGVLIFEFWWLLIILTLTGLVLFMIRENLREDMVQHEVRRDYHRRQVDNKKTVSEKSPINRRQELDYGPRIV